MANILVVDDEPEIVKLVAKILEARGHRVTTARDGEEALEEVRRERPDVVILDLNLPKIDGFEVCRRIKSDEATRRVPVVMLTAAYVSVDDAQRGLGLGADEYVVKPFLRDVLVHNVERLIVDAKAQTG
jgi:two-component system phosphate regulon response regulator PhoB/two-component system alkaline phosphatase synthesis response regulator PhoP